MTSNPNFEHELNSNLDTELLDNIIDFFNTILQDENINTIKLANSFAYSYYTTEKYSKTSSVMNFQISDENFLFSININKDDKGNITLFNIKKESTII